MRTDPPLQNSLPGFGDLKAALDEHAIVAVTDPQGIVTYVNDRFCAISKYGREEILGRDHRIFSSGYHPKEFFAELWSKLRAGQVWRGDIMNRDKDGEYFWIESTIVPFRDPTGNSRQFIAISSDITARKRAEIAAQAREARFLGTLEGIMEGCQLLGFDWTYLYLNEAAAVHNRRPRSELLGRKMPDMWPGLEATEFFQQFKRCMNERIAMHREVDFEFPDGSRGWFDVRCQPAPEGIFILSIDIGDRKRAEQLQRRLGAIVDSSDDAIVAKTLDGVIESWNAGAEKIFGYTAAEAIGRPITMLVPPERAGEEKEILSRIGRGEYVKHFATTRVRKDGRVIAVSVTISPIFSADGEIIGASKIARDVTERERSALEHDKLLTLIETSDDFIAMADLNGRLTYLNAGGRRMIGLPEGQDVGDLHFADYVPENWKDFFKNTVVRTARETGQWVGEMQLKHYQTGALVDVWRSTYLLKGPTGEILGYATVTRDITERKRAELALRESQSLYRSLVEKMPAGVFRKDLSGRYVFVNAYFCALRGCAPEQFLGKLPAELPAAESKFVPQANEHHAQIVREGKTIEVVDEYHRIDGKTLYFYVVKSPVFDPDGKIVGSQGVLLDITERRQTEAALQASEARARTTLSALSEGVVFLGANGEVEMANEAVRRILGRGVRGLPEAMRDTSTQYLRSNGESFPIEEQPAIVAMKTGKAVREVEIGMPLADGSIRWLMVNVEPVLSATGAVLGAVASFFEVTEQKRARERMLQLNAELEQRVKERTVELEAANRELEAFSYSVSHDLRAPLRAVDGFSQVVLEDYGSKLPADGIRYLTIIRSGAQKMGALIDDLLAFSRLGRQELRARPCDPGSIVRGVLQELGEPWPDRKVEIRIGELPSCVGDATLLKQVWMNLVGNALKYTRKRDRAIIEIGCKTEGPRPVFFIRDNGAGFEMRYADKLFGVFQRLHRAEEFEGTGVGLAIVQRIIHRHGGQIWAEAEPDRGATFSFTLNPKGKS